VLELTSTVDFASPETACEDTQSEGVGVVVHFPQHTAFFKEQRLLGVHDDIVKVVPPCPHLSLAVLVS